MTYGGNDALLLDQNNFNRGFNKDETEIEKRLGGYMGASLSQMGVRYCTHNLNTTDFY